MELTINGKIFPLRFGYGFLKEINNGAKVQSSGIALNMGVAQVVAGLQTGDVELLADVLKKANKTESPRLSDDDIEHLFESVDADQLFDDVFKELKKSQFTKTAVNRVLASMEEKSNEQAGE